MIQKDFIFIVDLMEEFTKQKTIRDRLNIIEKEDITGWEIWWQIEFASFLSNHNKIIYWKREFVLPVDKRTNWKKEKMAIDFLIKQKYSKKDKYIALELKQHKSMKQCITKMKIDIKKVNSIKKSYNILRSFWNIGMHKLEKDEKADKNINDVLDIVYKDCNHTKHIKNTNFAFTIF
jgi:hypothetical protein